jgi:hypothetical protein
VLNEEDLGDATVTTVWEFGLPNQRGIYIMNGKRS